MTYDGTLDLSPSSSSVIVNGLTMAGVNGTGIWDHQPDGAEQHTHMPSGTETLNNATVNIGNNSTDKIIITIDSAAAVLTLGSTTLTINQTGSNANYRGYDNRSGSGIVNAGTINAGLQRRHLHHW